ncbi:MAG: hypothetical protein AAF386_06650, partial [Pseudomonadota bacterium]
MISRAENICDLVCFRLRRSFPGQGLTAAITTAVPILQSAGPGPVALDLRLLGRLRHSECMALVELMFRTGGKTICAILANDQICAQLTDAGLDTFVVLAQTPADLAPHAPKGMLDDTSAIVFLDRHVPFLGPLADL